ncbi:MAG TPA: hypothetical protein VFS67_01635 [Polyangiaceae bacterium]|nr:hypothetical protein [Polyangiaceae bacterium]
MRPVSFGAALSPRTCREQRGARRRPSAPAPASPLGGGISSHSEAAFPPASLRTRFDDKLVRQLSVHRHVARYRLLVELCLLLWRHAFPTEQGATTRFAQFIADEQAMGLLFEQFIRGFLDVECPDVRLPSRNLEWCCSGSSEARKWLPRMEMDIPVQLGSQRLVLECKFYRNPWAEQRGRRTIHSAHLQQLYSYLENDHRQGGIRAHGVLLYAAAGDETRLDFELCGFPVSVRTLDLAQQWPRVDAAVRRLVAEWRAPTSTGQVFTSTG